MADIDIVFTAADLQGDFLLTPSGLSTGNDLKTAVLVSLFTERGWWADAIEPDPIGSDLLTLQAAKHSNETRLLAENYCRTALAWLIEDQIARSVDVTAAWQPNNVLGIRIAIAQSTGITKYSFDWNAV